MRKRYDFSGARRNPFAGRLKQQVTIHLDHGTVAYFKTLAEETGRRRRNGTQERAPRRVGAPDLTERRQPGRGPFFSAMFRRKKCQAF